MVTVSLLVLTVYVFTLVDVALHDRDRIRRLTKPVWLLLVILLPLVGSVLWFTLGRARRDPDAASAPEPQPALDPPSTDPSPTAAELAALEREIADAERQARIRRLEEELRRRTDAGGTA